MIFCDLTGMKFGCYTVVERDKNCNDRHIKWICRCDCGTVKSVCGDNLKSGKSTSCGCERKRILSQLRSTHGESKSKLYNVWCGMKTRCENANSEYYMYYGGRGIRLCDAWASNYKAFSDWAYANGYMDGLSIDRIDVDSGYSPDNCRWVDMKTQSNNRRSNINREAFGEIHSIPEWANMLGISRSTLYAKLHTGTTLEEAINFYKHN